MKNYVQVYRMPKITRNVCTRMSNRSETGERLGRPRCFFQEVTGDVQVFLSLTLLENLITKAMRSKKRQTKLGPFTLIINNVETSPEVEKPL